MQKQYDVIILGAGASGMAAALAVYENGSSVGLFEKQNLIGGTAGVSGGITPNHALGGSTSISVNIDASGTSVEGSEPNGEELGRLVAAAIQSELIKEKRPGGLLS